MENLVAPTCAKLAKSENFAKSTLLDLGRSGKNSSDRDLSFGTLFSSNGHHQDQFSPIPSLRQHLKNDTTNHGNCIFCFLLSSESQIESTRMRSTPRACGLSNSHICGCSPRFICTNAKFEATIQSLRRHLKNEKSNHGNYFVSIYFAL